MQITKLIHKPLTLTLALCSATTVWSQTALPVRGPHPQPLNLSMAAPSAAPAAGTSAATHYKFISIDIKGSSYAVADGINNNGLVTGYYQDSNSVYHGFIWRDGHLETVNYPGALYTKLYGVNNRGIAIGLYGNGATETTVTYDACNHLWTALPGIPNYPYNEGYGINDAGVAVGNAFSSTGSVAWVWDPETLSYSFFTVPGAAEDSTYPSGLNDKGQIAGYFADASGVYHGFIKEYATYTIINVPGAPYTYPDGLNNSGIIQGQIFDAANAAEGFVGTPGGSFTIVNYPGPTWTALVGINDRGDVCGSYSPAGSFTVATAFVALREEHR